MKHIFSLSLYLQGLKKIRLVGIISSVIMIISSSLPALFHILSANGGYGSGYTFTLDFRSFSYLFPLIIIIVPFFFLSMFSFLNHRNESDFYHAIPFKRSTVMVSFIASIYTWVFGIITVSVIVTGFIWQLSPNVEFAFSLILKLILIYMFSTVYIGGFVFFAMTLTGTVVANIAISGLLIFMLRSVAILFTLVLNYIVPEFDMYYSPLKILTIRYWLPSALIITQEFSDPGLWIFSTAVTIAVYAAGAYCYCKRKSESAGRSAPSKLLQHIYRCAFTTPCAILTAALCIINAGIGWIVTFAIITLLLYFLYEAFTTKSIASALRSGKFIFIPIACALIFASGCYLTRTVVLNQTYQAEDIQSFRLYRPYSLVSISQKTIYYGNYEKLAQNVEITDKDAKDIVAEGLNNIKRYNGKLNLYIAEADDVYISTSRFTESYDVIITLKSGRKIGRRITVSAVDYDDSESLIGIIKQTDEYKKAYLEIPDKEYILSYSSGIDNLSQKELQKLWKIYTEEYFELNDDDKYRLKLASASEYASEYDAIYNGVYSYYFISGYGMIDNSSYDFAYIIPFTFERTHQYLNTLDESGRTGVREHINEVISASGITSFQSSKYSIYIHTDNIEQTLQIALNSKTEGTEKEKELLAELLPFLTDTPTENGCCFISITSDYQHMSAAFGITDLNKEDEQKLALLFKYYENYLSGANAACTDILYLYGSGEYRNNCISGIPTFKFFLSVTDRGSTNKPIIYDDYYQVEDWERFEKACALLCTLICESDGINGRAIQVEIGYTDGDILCACFTVYTDNLSESEAELLHEVFGL